MENEIGTRIRAAREAKGMTLSELARALGITPQSVQAWEVGKTTPKGFTRIARICAVLDMKPADLNIEAPPGEVPPAWRYQFANRPFHDLPGLLREALPEEFRRNVDRTIDVQGARLRLGYLSRKVCVSLARVSGNPERGIVPFGIQNATYKLTVLRHSYGDYPLADRHYLVAAVDLDNQDLQIPGPVMAETRVLRMPLVQFGDMASLAAEIVRLEAADTELDIEYREAMNAPEPDISNPPDFDL